MSPALRLASRLHEHARGRPSRLDVRVLLAAAVIYALFNALEPIFHRTASLPLELYQGPSAFANAMVSSASFALGWTLSALGLAVAPGRVWWRIGRLGRRGSPTARWLWLPSAAAVTAVGWHLTTVDYNWALGQYFLLDRMILLLLAGAVMVHFAALPAFIVSALAFAGQLEVPPMHFSWTDTYVLYHAMLAIYLWSLWDALAPRRWAPPIASCFAVMLGVLAAWYFKPAIGKIRLRWLWETDLSYIFRAAYQQHGWWSVLTPAQHEGIAIWVSRLALPMQFMALLAETAVLFLLLTRRLTIGLLLLCLGMHIMIFLTVGIAFWKWAFLLVALVIVFARVKPRQWRRHFPISAMAATAVIGIVYAFFGARPPFLAWYDTPYVYRFRIEVTGESGARYEAIPATFAPFDSRFAQSRFFFLTESGCISDCFGSVNRRHTHHLLLEAETTEDVLEILDSRGERQTCPEKRAQLEAFFNRFLEASAVYEDRFDPNPDLIKASQHIWTNQRHGEELPLYRHQEPLVALDMTLIQWFFFDEGYREVAREHVLRVDREPDTPPAD